MSMVPLYLHLIDEMTPASLFDQDFGVSLLPSDLLQPRYHPQLRRRSHYARPWRRTHNNNSGMSHVENNKNEFKVNLDVKQFKPEEIGVKVVDKFVVVEGKHEEHQDEHGFISRQFTRRYLLPDDVDPQAVVSQLSSDGVLCIAAPKKEKAVQNERTISITQTGQPAVKATEEKKASEDKMEQ